MTTISTSVTPENGFSYDADSIGELLTYGHMAVDSYAGGGNNRNDFIVRAPEGWTAIVTTSHVGFNGDVRSPEDESGNELATFNSTVDTFQATAYRNDATGQIVIAYRGTDDGTNDGTLSGNENNVAGELINSAIPLGMGLSEDGVLGESIITDSYLQAAYDFYDHVLLHYAADDKSKLSFVGHSLGGITAGYMGAMTHIPALTFASGPHNLTVDYLDTLVTKNIHDAGLTADYSYITNNRVTGEILEAAIDAAKVLNTLTGILSIVTGNVYGAAVTALIEARFGSADRQGNFLEELDAGETFASSLVDSLISGRFGDSVSLHSMQIHQFLLYADHGLNLTEYKNVSGFLRSLFNDEIAGSAGILDLQSRAASSVNMRSEIVLSLLDESADVLTPLLQDAENILSQGMDADYGALETFEIFQPDYKGPLARIAEAAIEHAAIQAAEEKAYEDILSLSADGNWITLDAALAKPSGTLYGIEMLAADVDAETLLDFSGAQNADTVTIFSGTANIGAFHSASTANSFIVGGAGNDTILLSSGINYVFANDGNDTIYGGSGVDFIDGGSDSLFGSDTYVDSFDGGAVDQLANIESVTGAFGDGSYEMASGFWGSLFGGLFGFAAQRQATPLALAGPAVLAFAAEAETTEVDDSAPPRGDAGLSALVSSGVAELSFTPAGDMEVLSTASGQAVFTFTDFNWGDGNIFLDTGREDVSVLGSNGDDNLRGTRDADLIVGAEGNDVIRGRRGDDELSGEQGDDRLYGNRGNDDLYGDRGEDYLNGGWGDDRLWGGADNDRLVGSRGDDQLSGGQGDDKLYGGSGNDLLIGGLGADRLNGGYGVDTADYSGSDEAVTVDLEGGSSGRWWWHRSHGTGEGGEAEGDRLYSVENLIGSDEDDTLLGNRSANTLTGGDGADTLNGRRGNDTLEGGAGDDMLTGGYGRDTFIFSDGDGADTITDFDAGHHHWWGGHFGWGWGRYRSGDTLSFDLDGFDSADDVLAVASQSDDDVVFDFGDGDMLTLADTSLNRLDHNDFIFA